MSLVFGAATSDRIDVADAASLQTLTTFTILQWAYVTTLTSGRMTARKGTAVSNGWNIGLSGTTGNIRARVGCLTTVSDLITNTTPFATLGKWVCMAYTWAGTGVAAHLYFGDLVLPMVEATYGTNTNGSGAQQSDTGLAVAIGNSPGATVAWQGGIGLTALYNRVLTLTETESWRQRPTVAMGAVLFHDYDNPASATGAQFDLSRTKNTGTVTGATIGLRTPLRRVAPPSRFDIASGGGGGVQALDFYGYRSHGLVLGALGAGAIAHAA